MPSARPRAASPASAPPARDAMRDALATLTRFSAELSHVLDDGRKRSGRVAAPDLSGAHLPVFARGDPPAAALTADEPRRSRRSLALSRTRDPAPASDDRSAVNRSGAASANTSGSTVASAASSRSDGRRRRRDMYRSAVRTATRAHADPAAGPACFVTGEPVATLFDVDDYLITHDDHLWAAPALAGASRARERAREEDGARHPDPEEPRVSEGFFEGASGMRPPRPNTASSAPASVKGVTFAHTPAAAAPARSLTGSRSRKRREKSSSENSEERGAARRGPVRAATVQPGRTSLGARSARGAAGRAAQRASAPASGAGKKSQFVPGAETRFVKQQSYCKTGHVPGLRRTRFLRLIGSELVCYSRDLNKQLWAADVQHSFVKISHAQRKVVVFCVGARRPLVFFLASNDMLASWARALARASVAAFPRKYTSQKTAKELQREGIIL